MKATLCLIVLATASLPAPADDITFTNKTATFTNLQGQLYRRVQLVRGDLDGLIWRDKASGGRICYTNLHPDLLESFGISSDRIEIARARAQHKAIADARYRALTLAEAQARLLTRAEPTNAPSPAPWSGGPDADAPGFAYDPGVAYGPGFGYRPGFGYSPAFGYGPWGYYDPGFIYPGYVYGPPAPSAPSALSAPSVPLAPSAPSAPRLPPAFFLPPTARPSR